MTSQDDGGEWFDTESWVVPDNLSNILLREAAKEERASSSTARGGFKEEAVGSVSQGLNLASVTMASLEPFFALPLGEAAQRMGVGRSTLKVACRRLGLQRWPYTHQGQRRRARKGFARQQHGRHGMSGVQEELQQARRPAQVPGLRHRAMAATGRVVDMGITVANFQLGSC
ncbi:hypothetical protein GUITHDRAFT_110751 [Guillardia theta CCMP2712]|uniref:RWP-RK domain-containing protein n=1 Tax=Guillardia theta (strain CCMP2712) TaxID=905079 RepID=L1J4V4_GUITC|nr:hypothetical protein GUITHDRAFT_110751 [Guillardia theta CCMP2712]EKX43337.1 hypothetical protein GUITHDRAFT_110751 [Guillardia theta CCMP2712]|eukprot:XP_005830317.1 hypothetical protein GUITHDRAFT_110751 [Guillardia theta CCMP2712]